MKKEGWPTTKNVEVGQDGTDGQHEKTTNRENGLSILLAYDVGFDNGNVRHGDGILFLFEGSVRMSAQTAKILHLHTGCRGCAIEAQNLTEIRAYKTAEQQKLLSNSVKQNPFWTGLKRGLAKLGNKRTPCSE